MAVDRQTLFFFIIMFIFLSLPGGNNQPRSSRDRDTLTQFQEELKRSRSVLKNSTYIGGYGDLVGLKLSYVDNLENKNVSNWPFHHFTAENPWIEDEHYSMLPNIISDPLKEMWGPVNIDASTDKSYLLNISGKAYGSFIKPEQMQQITPFNLRLPLYLQQYYDYYTQNRYEEEKNRHEMDPDNEPEPTLPVMYNPKIGNITVSEGKLSVSMQSFDYNYKNPDLSKVIARNPDTKIDDATLLSLQLDFNDNEEKERHHIETHGVYFQDSGSIISITKSAKFFGLEGLPHFTLDEKNFETAKTLIGQYLNKSDTSQDVYMDDMNNFIARSQDQCEFINFFQLERTDFTKQELYSIDEELINPTGIPLPKELPSIKIKDYIIYSPDCGIILKSNSENLQGLKSEVSNRKTKNFIFNLLLLLLVQVYVFLRQVNECRTPGQLSTISSTTLLILDYQDSILTLGVLLLSSILKELYLISVSFAVIALIMCAVFEARFIASVLKTQANEIGTSWWEILRGSTRSDNNEDSPRAEERLPTATPPNATNPNEATVNTPETPEAGQDQVQFASGFGQRFILTIITTFFLLNVSTWRLSYRRVVEFIGFIFINSYWIPQFLRNTLKNRRRSFSWEFILCNSIIRLLPVSYLCLDKSNALRHHFDPQLVATLVSWVTFQVFLLYLQSKFGARFWVNERWLPKAYDYHQVISIKDLESGFASDILSNVSTNADGSLHSCIDCAICMTTIDVPVITERDKKLSSSTKDYMVTPCFHIFHTECLGDWMKYKLQCPVCRNSLPPM